MCPPIVPTKYICTGQNPGVGVCAVVWTHPPSATAAAALAGLGTGGVPELLLPQSNHELWHWGVLGSAGDSVGDTQIVSSSACSLPPYPPQVSPPGQAQVMEERTWLLQLLSTADAGMWGSRSCPALQGATVQIAQSGTAAVLRFLFPVPAPG